MLPMRVFRAIRNTIIKMAAQSGDARAQRRWGDVCVERDIREATKWYQEAAHRGDGRSAANCAVLFQGMMRCEWKVSAKDLADGNAIEKELKKPALAVLYRVLGARAGDPECCRSLASLYEKGQQVEKNPSFARDLRKTAAVFERIPPDKRPLVPNTADDRVALFNGLTHGRDADLRPIQTPKQDQASMPRSSQASSPAMPAPQRPASRVPQRD